MAYREPTPPELEAVSVSIPAEVVAWLKKSNDRKLNICPYGETKTYKLGKGQVDPYYELRWIVTISVRELSASSGDPDLTTAIQEAFNKFRTMVT
jgi:hypothetical protein